MLWKKHFAAHFGNSTLSDYSSDRALDFIKAKMDAYGTNRLKNLRVLARSVFALAVEQRYLTVNPWDRLSGKGAKKKKPKGTAHYTRKEFLSILANQPHADAKLILVNFFLTMRPNEIMALGLGFVLERRGRRSPSFNRSRLRLRRDE